MLFFWIQVFYFICTTLIYFILEISRNNFNIGFTDKYNTNRWVYKLSASNKNMAGMKLHKDFMYHLVMSLQAESSVRRLISTRRQRLLETSRTYSPVRRRPLPERTRRKMGRDGAVTWTLKTLTSPCCTDSHRTAALF